MKLAGDTLVILNSTILHRNYPIFADPESNPIIENNEIIKVEVDTAFNIYDRGVFHIVDGDYTFKDLHKDTYEKAIKDLERAAEVKKAVEEADAKKAKETNDV